MEVKVKKVREGDRIIHPLGSYSSIGDDAPEDGLVFNMGLSKPIYVPLSKLRVFLDNWEEAPEKLEFDPWKGEG